MDGDPGDPLDLYSSQVGRCHICRTDHKVIDFCGLCGHWWCKACDSRIAERGVEWARGVLGRLKPGCCGPAGVRMVAMAKLVSLSWEREPEFIASGEQVDKHGMVWRWTWTWHGFRILVARRWRRELVG